MHHHHHKNKAETEKRNKWTGHGSAHLSSSNQKRKQAGVVLTRYDVSTNTKPDHHKNTATERQLQLHHLPAIQRDRQERHSHQPPDKIEHGTVGPSPTTREAGVWVCVCGGDWQCVATSLVVPSVAVVRWQRMWDDVSTTATTRKRQQHSQDDSHGGVVCGCGALCNAVSEWVPTKKWWS
jgi:hypothetical protein